MKISARTCTNTPVKPEPDLEFYLEDGDKAYVELKVMDKANGLTAGGVVLRVNKLTGKLHRITGVNKLFGLPLDEQGRVKLSSEA